MVLQNVGFWSFEKYGEEKYPNRFKELSLVAA